jgi:hypothetical protein
MQAPPTYIPLAPSPALLPPSQPQTSYQPTLKDKQIGKNFNRLVIITILFIVFSNGYKFLEGIYAMVTSKVGEIFNTELCQPTMKGYILMTVLFFISISITSY